MQPKEKNYITPAGYQKLSQEWDHLWKVERPKVTQLVSWAASNGDRSENADYTYGKKRLREIDRRLRFLKKRLELAVVVKHTHPFPDKVQFGAQVTVVDEKDQEKTYTIVGVDEIQGEEKKISWKSPLGASLLGKKVGDSATFSGPKGEMEITVLNIRY